MIHHGHGEEIAMVSWYKEGEAIREQNLLQEVDVNLAKS